jgi:hypothetical protein
VGCQQCLGHRRCPDFAFGVATGYRAQVSQEVGCAPGVYRGSARSRSSPSRMRVPANSPSTPPASISPGRASAGVHPRQVLGAGRMHAGQSAGGAAGGLIGVQHRGGAPQSPHKG